MFSEELKLSACRLSLVRPHQYMDQSKMSCTIASFLQRKRLMVDVLVGLFIFVCVTALNVTSVFCRSMVRETRQPALTHTSTSVSNRYRIASSIFYHFIKTMQPALTHTSTSVSSRYRIALVSSIIYSRSRFRRMWCTASPVCWGCSITTLFHMCVRRCRGSAVLSPS